jgi:hypothetical protein
MRLERGGGEPGLGGGDVVAGEGVGGGKRFEIHLGAAGAEMRGEAARVVGRNERILIAAEQKRAFTDEGIGRGGTIDDDHRADEDRAAEHDGAQEQERGGDVGAVGKADGDQTRDIDPVAIGGGADEVGEFVGALRDLGGIEHALGQAGEESGGAALADFAAGRE